METFNLILDLGWLALGVLTLMFFGHVFFSWLETKLGKYFTKNGKK